MYISNLLKHPKIQRGIAEALGSQIKAARKTENEFFIDRLIKLQDNLEQYATIFEKKLDNGDLSKEETEMFTNIVELQYRIIDSNARLLGYYESNE